MHSISIRHNFEAAHRLPHLKGKCQSVHGHSFWAEVTIGTDVRLPASGIVVEYAEAKQFVRNWIDRFWDHGILLGAQDPLVKAAKAGEYAGASDVTDLLGKTYLFGGRLAGDWPTVETLAWHLGVIVANWCRDRNVPNVERDTRGPHLVCEQVTIRETAVNAATWINPEAG
jgi:6-pyruvoyltetrahydropterin/6-carboxytetrahydropterin synthase